MTKVLQGETMQRGDKAIVFMHRYMMNLGHSCRETFGACKDIIWMTC
jgi:hypothetical protein